MPPQNLDFSEAIHLLLELEDELRERKRFRQADSINFFLQKYRQKLKEIINLKYKLKKLEEKEKEEAAPCAASPTAHVLTSDNPSTAATVELDPPSAEAADGGEDMPGGYGF